MQIDRFIVLGVSSDYCSSGINLRRISTWYCCELAWNPGDGTSIGRRDRAAPPSDHPVQEFVRLRSPGYIGQIIHASLSRETAR